MAIQFEQISPFVESVSSLLKTLQDYTFTPPPGCKTMVCDMGDHKYYWNGYTVLKDIGSLIYQYNPKDGLIHHRDDSGHYDYLAEEIYKACRTRAGLS